MQVCNNTLNSVLDCDSNKTNTEKIVERGRSYIRWKVWLSDTLFTLFKYGYILCLFYIVRVYDIFQAEFCGGIFVWSLWKKPRKWNLLHMSARLANFTKHTSKPWLLISLLLLNRHITTGNVIEHRKSSINSTL
jgi:hypothetical protein